MSSFRSHSSAPRRLRPAALPLTEPEDAVTVLLAATDVQRPETVALLLDDAHRGLGCVVLEGDGTPFDVDRAAELLVEVARRSPDLGAVVLGTVRADRSIVADPYDEQRFIEARARFDEVDVDLLDWFLIGPGVVASIGELTDAEWRWHDAEPPR